MKARMLWICLLALVGQAGCAHQPAGQGATTTGALEGTAQVQYQPACANGLTPYQQILADPGWF